MNFDKAIDSLNALYGDASWLKAMRAFSPEATKGFSRLAEGTLAHGPLPAKIKHFMPFVIYLSERHEDLARLHADAAARMGATPQEWHEILMLFSGSRGTAMYIDGARITGLSADQATPVQDTDSAFESRENILAYFGKAMGKVPAFVQLLADHKPVLFEGYFKLRSENLKDGSLPQKYKELMLVAINSAERYQTGIEIHGRAALGCGASHEELLDAMTVAILGGGIPAWIEASQVYERLTT
ncbi:MAG: carboxymuconolactone decarboxylase family protein [Pseudomonadota bacterium]